MSVMWISTLEKNPLFPCVVAYVDAVMLCMRLLCCWSLYMLLCHYFHTGNITSKRPSYVVREKVCRYVATIVKLGSTDPIFCILVGRGLWNTKIIIFDRRFSDLPLVLMLTSVRVLCGQRMRHIKAILVGRTLSTKAISSEGKSP